MFVSRNFLLSLCILAPLTPAEARSKQEPLQEIYRYGDALNIEAGQIPKHCLQAGQIWANLCMVLDRPFHNGLELHEITEQNVFALKEANLMEYNERRAALAQAIALKYYITETHRLAGCDPSETAHLIVQVHRRSTGPAHVKFLRCLIDLMKLNPEEDRLDADGVQHLCFKANKINVELRSGVQPGNYDGAHLVLSIGVAAGLNPRWKSGTFMLPQCFTPFDIKTAAIMLDKSYVTKNHLLNHLEEVLALQNTMLLEAINENYTSQNPAKDYEVTTCLQKEDFYPASLLQVNGIFNPSKMPSSVSVLESSAP